MFSKLDILFICLTFPYITKGIVLPSKSVVDHKRIDALIKDIFSIPPSSDALVNETVLLTVGNQNCFNSII